MRIKIKGLISFDIERISKKNAFSCSRCELMLLRIDIGGITKTTKQLNSRN